MELNDRTPTRRGNHWLAVALVLWFTAAHTACPDPAETDGPTDKCTSIGQQCRLGRGQLGVRTQNAHQELECTPQH